MPRPIEVEFCQAGTMEFRPNKLYIFVPRMHCDKCDEAVEEAREAYGSMGIKIP